MNKNTDKWFCKCLTLEIDGSIQQGGFYGGFTVIGCRNFDPVNVVSDSVVALAMNTEIDDSIFGPYL